MKKFKFVACILAITTAFLFAAGCAGKDEPVQSDPNASAGVSSNTAASEPAEDGLYSGEPVTLRMMVFGATEAYEKINEGFLELYPEIKNKVKLEVELGGSGDFDVAQKIRLSLAANEALPDIVRFNYTQLPEFAESGILEPIDRFIQPYRSEIIEGALEVMKYKDTFYAFPREIKPKIWFYRTDIFEDCGIDPAQVKTVDEFIAVGEKIQEKYPNAHLENYNVPGQQYDLTMLLTANGGRFCDEQGNYIVSSDAGVKSAFETIKKIHDSKVNSTVAEWSADWSKAFADGELVSQLMAGWFRQDMMNWKIEKLRGKIGLALWPEEIRQGSEAGAAIWVIPENSKNKEIAGDVMAKMCFEKDAAELIYKTVSIVPAIKSAVTDPAYNAPHEYYANNIAQINFKAMEFLKVYPYTPASSQEIKIVMQYLDEYVAGKMTVDEALKAAEADLKNQIGNPYQQ